MIIPTISTYAKNETEAAYPELRKHLTGAYLPFMGKQGNKLINFAIPGKNTGNFVSNIAWGLDADGIYVDFPDTSSYINCGSSSGLGSGHDLTFLMCLKTTASEVGYIWSDTSGLAPGQGVYFQGTTDKLLYVPGNLPSNAVFSDTTKMCIGVTITAGGNIQFFKNGTPAGTASGAVNQSTSTDFYIGNRPSGSGAALVFTGQLFWMQIFNRILTPLEIKWLTLNPYSSIEILDKFMYAQSILVSAFSPIFSEVGIHSFMFKTIVR